MKRALVVLALCTLLTRFGSTAYATDIPDYDPHSQAWNGLANFVALAEGMGFDVQPVASLD
jgi:hypothetical protein